MAFENNSNFLGVNKEYSIYVPTANLQYKYTNNITADYIDLYDVPQLESNHSYTYIRVFYDRPGLVDYKVTTTNNYYQTTTLKPVNVSDDFFARNDSFHILGVTAIIILFLGWGINCVTEFFNKGGLFH